MAGGENSVGCRHQSTRPLNQPGQKARLVSVQRSHRRQRGWPPRGRGAFRTSWLRDGAVVRWHAMCEERSRLENGRRRIVRRFRPWPNRLHLGCHGKVGLVLLCDAISARLSPPVHPARTLPAPPARHGARERQQRGAGPRASSPGASRERAGWSSFAPGGGAPPSDLPSPRRRATLSPRPRTARRVALTTRAAPPLPPLDPIQVATKLVRKKPPRSKRRAAFK